CRIFVSCGVEMRDAVYVEFPPADVVIMAAAVTDYRAASPRAGKTKDASWELKLVKVGNILQELAGRRRAGQVVVGFAAETGDPEAEGGRKLAERGLDLVVANDVSVPGSGFGADDNRAVLLHADGRRERLPLMPKRALAEAILGAVEPLLGRVAA
ncbi:MAG: phosphopantothenoylcysteine decarboxylase, partial [bacterium]